MQALKILVVVMGVMIVAGVALIAVTIAKRLSGTGEPAGFGTARVELPPGARIVGMQADGGRLVLRLVIEGGPEQVLVVDLASGQPLGRLELIPGR